MRMLSALSVVTILSGGCAATQAAYVQKHPDQAQAVAIASAAAACVDPLIAGVILEEAWQTVTVNGLACVASLIAQNLLERDLEAPAREAVRSRVAERLAARTVVIKRALDAADPKASGRIDAGEDRKAEVLPSPYK